VRKRVLTARLSYFVTFFLGNGFFVYEIVGWISLHSVVKTHEEISLKKISIKSAILSSLALFLCPCHVSFQYFFVNIIYPSSSSSRLSVCLSVVSTDIPIRKLLCSSRPSMNNSIVSTVPSFLDHVARQRKEWESSFFLYVVVVKIKYPTQKIEKKEAKRRRSRRLNRHSISISCPSGLQNYSVVLELSRPFCSIHSVCLTQQTNSVSLNSICSALSVCQKTWLNWKRLDSSDSFIVASLFCLLDLERSVWRVKAHENQSCERNAFPPF
jgi:hypothetical protein